MNYNYNGRLVIMFSLISILALVGCGGSAAQPQNKTTTPPIPPAAVVFTGTFNLNFSDSVGPNAMEGQFVFSQTDTNITGNGVPHQAVYGRTGLSGCIDLANSTVTGTIQGSNFAMILTDPNRQTANIKGSINPINATYNITFPASCAYMDSNMTGTVTFQKLGA